MYINKLKKYSMVFMPLLFLVMLLFFNSCKDNTVTNGSSQASVSLVANNTPTDASASVVLVDSAKFLIETVRLHRTNDSSTIKVGPFKVYLNLHGILTDFGIANVPPGTYDRVSFKFHKFTPGEQLPSNDSDFVGPNGGVGYSAIIGGTFDGLSFVYRSPKTAHQFITISPPLIVPENSTTSAVFNVTISCQWTTWFVKNGMTLDPRDPANQNDIDNNIKDSFNKAFRDLDKNGIPDTQ